MLTKRKDNKGRILRDNEFQKSDGRYEYRYYGSDNRLHSIYSWRLTESDPTPSGKRRCESLRELEKKALKDTDDRILRTKATLNDRWDDYISNKPELKQSTRTNYKYMYDKYIRESIGNVSIASINYSFMKKFFNKLIHEVGFKPNSLETIHTILHPVFSMAVKDSIIRTNPTDGIMADLKRSNDWEIPKRHSLTESQQKAFMEYVRNSSQYNHWLPLFTCLLGTGCRIAEMLGLRWCDIDWERNMISINHSLIYRLQDSGKVEYRVTTPKTRKGTREIPMFKNVRDTLKAEYERQSKTGFCQKVIDGYSGFIWQNRYGDVLNAHCINRAIKRILKAYHSESHQNGEIIPEFSVHQLRHTFCTRLCENETDLKLIQEVMGHANISTTMDIYNESNMDRKQASFSRLEALNSVF